MKLNPRSLALLIVLSPSVSTGFTVSIGESIHRITGVTLKASSTIESDVVGTKLSRSGADMKAWGKGFSNCPQEV